MRRPAWLDQHGQARLDGILSELFLVSGIVDRAVGAARRAVEHPDRQGVHSGTSAQSDAAAALRYAVALRQLSEREREDAVTATPWESAKLRARSTWHAAQAWRQRRRAAVLLAEEKLLVSSMRPYYVGSIEASAWMIPEAVSAVGGGVARSAIRQARALETLPGASAYLDAMEMAADFDRGACASVRDRGEATISALPTAEVMLRARLAILVGECARRAGDTVTADRHFARAMEKDPDLFRRLGLSLPVDVLTDGSELAAEARDFVGRSPRFDVGRPGFHVVLRGGAHPEACLQGPTHEQLACAHVNLPVDTKARAGARLLVAEFHRAAFALKADLSQADLTSLDGSPASARADKQVQSLLDTMGQGANPAKGSHVPLRAR